MKKIIVALCMVLLVLTTAGFAAFAEEVTDEVSSAEIGIRLEDATPEEIEDIGMGAMLQAGLISESDANISDVTPIVIPEEPETQPEAKSSTLEIVLLVLVVVLILAVVVLYVLCAMAGVFTIEKGHPLYKIFKK